MNWSDCNSRVFKFNVFLIIGNIVFMMLFLSVIVFFSKSSLEVGYKILSIMVVLFLGYYLISPIVVSIEVNSQDKQTVFTRRQFVFQKRILAFKHNEFNFSYKQEMGGRGSKHMALTIYNIDNEKIIQFTPLPNGWSDTKITTITMLWRKMGVKEIMELS